MLLGIRSRKELFVYDLVSIFLTAVFFTLCVGLVRLMDRLREDRS